MRLLSPSRRQLSKEDTETVTVSTPPAANRITTYESIGPSNSTSASSTPTYNFFSALHQATATISKPRRHTAGGGSSGESTDEHLYRRALGEVDNDRRRRERGGGGGGDGGGSSGDDDGHSQEDGGVVTCNTTCLGVGGTVSCRGAGRAVVLGLLLWATVASVAVAFMSWQRAASFKQDLSASNSPAKPRGHNRQRREGPGTMRPPSSSMQEAAVIGVGASSSQGWCLPNAVHQTFSGLILKENNDVIEEGEWEGDHWWYHDAITNCFHIRASVGGETYGFWEAGIINVSGTTNYITAAYKNGECLYYQEELVAPEPINDVMCRGTAWVGNVTLQGDMEYGYGTKAERWAGTIPRGHNSGQWGLPPGTKSVIDFTRNPDNENEARLLYHKVVAPTTGVLSWAGGDSMAFDFVFADAESMRADEVQALVKVPPVCEVMAGEFHDQQARNAQHPGQGSPGGRRRMSSTKNRGGDR